MRTVLALATLAALTACAGPAAAPGPAPAPDIAGTYTLNTTVQGSAVEGRMEITGEPGAYGGSVYTDATGRLPISSVTMDGSVATIILDTTQGPVAVRIEFSGDSYAGEWSAGEESGAVRGRKVGS